MVIHGEFQNIKLQDDTSDYLQDNDNTPTTTTAGLREMP